MSASAMSKGDLSAIEKFKAQKAAVGSKSNGLGGAAGQDVSGMSYRA